MSAIPALPQGAQTGALAGVVKDSTEAVIPGATVEIFDETTGTVARSLKSAADGSYVAPLLKPGSYRLEVSATGFKLYKAVAVPVRINETVRHDAVLEVGAVQETVTVEARPILVNPEAATTGQPVDSRTLAALPIPVPNFLFLLSLSPGSAGEPPDVRAANRGIVDINVNGQRTTNNSVSIEGINVNDFNLGHFDTVPLPNPNAIQEFKVATSLYDASMGSKGGGALTLVLKSGTKEVHGEAYWQHRNDALNANEWFRNAQRLPRARLLQNVLGFSGSAPVPKLGGFWFANVHGVRLRNGLDPSGATVSPVIPNFPAGADGATSAALLASAYGLNPAQIDPVAVNLLNLKNGLYGGQYLIPRPGQPGCQVPGAGAVSFRCTFSKPAPLSDSQFTITHDRYLRGGKDKLAVRWFYDNLEVTRPYGTATSSGLSFPLGAVQRNRFISLSHTLLISSRQTNEFRFGFSRYNSSTSPSDPVTLADVGATRPNIQQVPGIYSVDITGLFKMGVDVNDDKGTISNQFQWGDTWSMTAGKHTLRAGGEAVRYQLNRFNRFAVRGGLTFGATSGTDNTFTAFQNFLQGRVTQLQSAAGDPQRYFRDTDFAGFLQDDWRIHPRLTLNLGIRWEGIGFAHDRYFRTSIYDPTLLLQSPPHNPYLLPEKLNFGGVQGTPGVSDCTLNTCFDKNNWGPRIGFAWDVQGRQETVVRGGYGIYYQRLSNQNILQGSLGAPFFVSLADTRANPQALQLKDPLGGQLASASLTAYVPRISRFAGLRRASGSGPLDPNDPNVAPIFVNEAGEACSGFGGSAPNCVINLASFATPSPSARTPYTQQWNLTVQRALWSSWAAEAGYVGTRYVGGLGTWDPYLARLASPSSPIVVTDANGASYTITANTPNNEPLRHQILGVTRSKGSRIGDNVGQGTYHSAQFTLSHRFYGGLFFQAAYTFSKIIDNVSGSQGTDEFNATRNGQLGSNIYRNDPSGARALGDFNRPHRFVVSYAYDLPAPKNGLWGSQIFQGWSISGIVTYQNGLPFTILDSTSGGAFGVRGIGTGMLACRPASEQIAALPGCTPGQPTTSAQALLSGRIQDRLNNYINPNVFSKVPEVPNGAGGATGFGVIPRNVFRAPFQQDWDFSLAKSFKVREKQSLQFRMDLFNLWNHPVFSPPAQVNLDTPGTFGQITTTLIPARLIQFGLKYAF